MNQDGLTTSEVAAILGMSQDQVRRLTAQGLMTCDRTEGKHRRYSVKAVRRCKVLLRKYRKWNLPV